MCETYEYKVNFDAWPKTLIFLDFKNLKTSYLFKVNWLERLIDVGNGNYCVLGFHSSSFVVHSISDAVNLSEVTCGGGHRSWDFNGVDFAFIKDRQLMFCKEFMTSDASMTIKTGLHSLVINCVEHCHFGSKVEGAI